MTQGVKTSDQVATSKWIQALLFQQITAAQFVQISNLKFKRKRKGKATQDGNENKEDVSQ